MTKKILVDWDKAIRTIEDIVDNSILSSKPFTYHSKYYEHVKKLDNHKYEFNFKEYMSDVINPLLDDYNFYVKEHGFTSDEAKKQAFFDSYYDMLEGALNPGMVKHVAGKTEGGKEI